MCASYVIKPLEFTSLNIRDYTPPNQHLEKGTLCLYSPQLPPPPLVMALIGTGCSAAWMWRISSPINLPTRSPGKSFRTEAEEEEVSGFTATHFLWSMGPCVICPP